MHPILPSEHVLKLPPRKPKARAKSFLLRAESNLTFAACPFNAKQFYNHALLRKLNAQGSRIIFHKINRMFERDLDPRTTHHL